MDFRPERSHQDSEIFQEEGKKKARSVYDGAQVWVSVEIELVAVVGVAGCTSEEVAIEEVAASSYSIVLDRIQLALERDVLIGYTRAVAGIAAAAACTLRFPFVDDFRNVTEEDDDGVLHHSVAVVSLRLRLRFS